MPPFAAIVLAAGKSTRMRSSKPKALHCVAGRPMLVHILKALELAGAERIVVVVGHGADQIVSEIGDRVEYVEQADQRGTGHAVQVTKDRLSNFVGTIVVLPGDAPLISADVIGEMVRCREGHSATMLSVELDPPTGYGRVLRDGQDGRVIGVVEEKDADADQRAIREVNVSMYAFDPAFLYAALDQIQPNNAQGEYYLTDTIGIANRDGSSVTALKWSDAAVGRGANTRVDLAELDAIMHQRILREHMLAGVGVIDPLSTRVEADVKIGADTVLWPFTVLRGVTDIGESCEIGPGARIDDSRVGDRTRVRDSWIVASEIGSDTTVGPYANIRPSSTIGNRVKIGDFVEIKASTVDDDVSAGHFAYLGDASVGEATNIGAGTITCNYDGYRKHKTTIGKRAFVGSNSTLVAPVDIGDGAYIAAGSAITSDVPAGSLAVGRARQTVKPDWAARRRDRSAANSATEDDRGDRVS